MTRPDPDHGPRFAYRHSRPEKSQVADGSGHLTCQHKNPWTLLVEGPEIKIRPVGSGRFCAEELQAMIDLYISGATSSQVAEWFGISVSSVKRVLRDHGTRK